MAASSASHRPIKGILKNRSSMASNVLSPSEQQRDKSVEELSKKSQRWDEVNIVATNYASDEDYGLVKIYEPSTPYNIKKLSVAEGSETKDRVREQESSGDEDGDLPPEQAREKKQEFEMKRKLHDSEGLNIKLARQLIEKDLDDEEENEETAKTATKENMNMEESNQGSTTCDQLQNKSESS
ncbi:protein phosphatase inhibitor 2-like isoform X2 [Molossus molossus]|uniref:protein phosphatase inhibitor 2-like isoform X2 n=1 Tax=Molossus molossus TaxID=27622 RepID=UPI001745FF21|nr:protein phosphatase inhibitor 2-like isoform X2 [Molossus molossus]